MRVFISYGHQPPENAALVRRICARLDDDRFETWIDDPKVQEGWIKQPGIAHGDDYPTYPRRPASRDPSPSSRLALGSARDRKATMSPPLGSPWNGKAWH